MRVPALPEEPSNLHSWIRRVFLILGRRPSQRLGQVFLVDPRGIRAFIDAVAGLLAPPIVEIGVGPGHITYYVSAHTGPVVGVEIDEGLARIAVEVLEDRGSSVLLGDGVSLIEALKAPGFYSNTPYGESSRIIAAAARNNNINRALLGLQLEVARRVLAEPGSSEYGRLTLLVRRYFNPVEVARLPREWFYPRPEVHGSLVLLERIREWREGDECFERVTACLFTGRNKLADKMASKCLGVARGELSLLSGKRVRDLTVGDIEWMLEKAGGCTRRPLES